VRMPDERNKANGSIPRWRIVTKHCGTWEWRPDDPSQGEEPGRWIRVA
jgi:hypothetical protein